ncbi:MAG TPA: hypothetical protein VF972_11025, partial [Actinomycetota bacterium]
SAPFDILELRPEGELVTRVLSIEQGPMPVNPRDQRPSKLVPGVRLYVPPEDKQTEPPYWDVTAQLPKAAILTLGAQAVSQGRFLKLHKYGSGPGARFSVELLPADYSGGPKAETLNAAGP